MCARETPGRALPGTKCEVQPAIAHVQNAGGISGKFCRYQCEV
jgi:hypothetical protein